MTIGDLVSYLKCEKIGLRVSCETSGICSVQLFGRGRLGIAEAPEFEDALEMAKLRYESGWKAKTGI